MSGDFDHNNELERASESPNLSSNGLDQPGSPTVTAKPASPVTDRINAKVTPPTVAHVMSSDIGINTLLVRLKQSIASARDFATFLKKRSSLEEAQAAGLKRLSRDHMDRLKHSDYRDGSYATQLAEVLRCHDRMADNGMQFALSLHQMHEDLTELSNNIERGRKQWKHEGLDAEKRASDAEAAMHKAKARYDSLAEDYDRARTGDTKGSRRIGLKGPKSAEQYESEMSRKVQAADADYQEKVKIAKTQRETLLRDGRPRATKGLKELCTECDNGLTLQLQKFATFNEKLLLGNGLTVSPLNDKDGPASQRSLREVIQGIDNESDFNTFIGSHSSKVNRPTDIQYEQHPTLMPKQSQPTPANRTVSSAGPLQPAAAQSQTPLTPANLAAGTGVGTSSQPGSMNNRFANQGPQQPSPLVVPQQPSPYQPPSPSVYTSSPGTQHMQSPLYGQSPYISPQQQQQPSRDNYNSPPYPTHPSERSAATPLQTTGVIPAPIGNTSTSAPNRQFSNQPPQNAASSPKLTSPPSKQLPPTRPIFGVALGELFARDQIAVPMVVIQCILAVDTFGLEVEGIYRMSGTASHVNQLRDQFNHNASQVDFRNPAAFNHDVNSVATLLKQFFRDLPDPLFTAAGYSHFIAAARLEDDNARRDALHQNINDLPDPNYATLRALVLHLNRVMSNESRNRMGASNLALCFAPSLMGQHTGSQIADASLQARVLDTILVNAIAIFDED
ncbi:RhoGAP-domain-containing protein [Acrodontium crateriforme]|uniref:RhoGAP-domain-containing protein n=1 Tax=Acrodontium crateriforme TaxID=150365 RepID=A0AAQ3M0A3_9PEZI|nr:RhoGAP-domain-containing protein [Acrodontium crateriforme]